MRFFKELFNRSLKCERVGHKPRAVKRTGFVRPEGAFRHRIVAEKVRQCRVICSRCKTPLSEWDERSRSPIHSLKMEEDRWEELEDTGETWELTEYE